MLDARVLGRASHRPGVGEAGMRARIFPESITPTGGFSSRVCSTYRGISTLLSSKLPQKALISYLIRLNFSSLVEKVVVSTQLERRRQRKGEEARGPIELALGNCEPLQHNHAADEHLINQTRIISFFFNCADPRVPGDSSPAQLYTPPLPGGAEKIYQGTYILRSMFCCQLFSVMAVTAK